MTNFSNFALATIFKNIFCQFSLHLEPEVKLLTFENGEKRFIFNNVALYSQRRPKLHDAAGAGTTERAPETAKKTIETHSAALDLRYPRIKDLMQIR